MGKGKYGETLFVTKANVLKLAFERATKQKNQNSTLGFSRKASDEVPIAFETSSGRGPRVARKVVLKILQR